MIRATIPAALVAMMLATPAAAQQGVLWNGGPGQTVALGFGGLPPVKLEAIDRPVIDMAAWFKQLCVDPNGTPAAIGVAAAKAGLDAQPLNFPARGKQPGIAIPLWRGRGVALAQTDGFLQLPTRQCALTFQILSPPSPASLADAVSAELGTAPVNAAEAVKKNGKPNAKYCPEWAVTGPDGTEWIAAAIVSEANRFDPLNRVHLSLRVRERPIVK